MGTKSASFRSLKHQIDNPTPLVCIEASYLQSTDESGLLAYEFLNLLPFSLISALPFLFGDMLEDDRFKFLLRLPVNLTRNLEILNDTDKNFAPCMIVFQRIQGPESAVRAGLYPILIRADDQAHLGLSVGSPRVQVEG